MSAVEVTVASSDASLLRAPYAAASIGMLALMSIIAFEQLAVATVMPVVAVALRGSTLYAAAFGMATAAGILGMVVSGRWSDRRGPAAPMYVGSMAFALGLAIAGFASDMHVFVLGRALQGAGAGVLSVALYVIVGRNYPAALHSRVFAAFAAAYIVPAIVGPALAGVIEREFGWRWVFLFASALALPALLLLYRGLSRIEHVSPPRPRDVELAAPTNARSRIYVAGVVAVAAGLLYISDPFSGPQGFVVAIALLLLMLFAPRLLPAGTFSGRAGLPAVIALRGLSAAAFAVGEVFLPLILTSKRGLTPIQAGVMLTLGALGWSFGSWILGRKESMTGDDATCIRVLRAGMAAIVLGLVIVVCVLSNQVPIFVAGFGWTLTGLGIGIVYPTLPVLLLRFAPAAEQGAASSALQLSDSLFTAVGLAAAGAIASGAVNTTSNAPFIGVYALAIAIAVTGVCLASRAHRANEIL
jgi:MFS family permease